MRGLGHRLAARGSSELAADIASRRQLVFEIPSHPSPGRDAAARASADAVLASLLHGLVRPLREAAEVEGLAGAADAADALGDPERTLARRMLDPRHRANGVPILVRAAPPALPGDVDSGPSAAEALADGTTAALGEGPGAAPSGPAALRTPAFPHACAWPNASAVSAGGLPVWRAVASREAAAVAAAMGVEDTAALGGRLLGGMLAGQSAGEASGLLAADGRATERGADLLRAAARVCWQSVGQAHGPDADSSALVTPGAPRTLAELIGASDVCRALMLPAGSGPKGLLAAAARQSRWVRLRQRLPDAAGRAELTASPAGLAVEPAVQTVADALDAAAIMATAASHARAARLGLALPKGFPRDARPPQVGPERSCAWIVELLRRAQMAAGEDQPARGRVAPTTTATEGDGIPGSEDGRTAEESPGRSSIAWAEAMPWLDDLGFKQRVAAASLLLQRLAVGDSPPAGQSGEAAIPEPTADPAEADAQRLQGLANGSIAHLPDLVRDRPAVYDLAASLRRATDEPGWGAALVDATGRPRFLLRGPAAGLARRNGFHVTSDGSLQLPDDTASFRPIRRQVPILRSGGRGPVLFATVAHADVVAPVLALLGTADAADSFAAPASNMQLLVWRADAGGSPEPPTDTSATGAAAMVTLLINEQPSRWPQAVCSPVPRQPASMHDVACPLKSLLRHFEACEASIPCPAHVRL